MPIKVGPARKNTSRENRLEELGRVDAEKAYTSKGKRNLKDEKTRIVRELKAKGGQISREGSANYKSDRHPSQQKRKFGGAPRSPEDRFKNLPKGIIIMVPDGKGSTKKIETKAKGGLIKGKPKLAKRGWK